MNCSEGCSWLDGDHKARQNIFMTSTLPVRELEAQIHALSYEDKLRIACFAQREVSTEARLDDEPPEWVKDELFRREKLEEQGLDTPQPWEQVRARLLNRFRR
jgi:hypothetical protein